MSGRRSYIQKKNIYINAHTCYHIKFKDNMSDPPPQCNGICLHDLSIHTILVGWLWHELAKKTSSAYPSIYFERSIVAT